MAHVECIPIYFNIFQYSWVKVIEINLEKIFKLVMMMAIMMMMIIVMMLFFLFSIWVFFHEHSRFTGQQGKGGAITLTPLYHFHPLHRQLDISRAITAGSSPLHIASSRTRTGTFRFRVQVANH